MEEETENLDETHPHVYTTTAHSFSLQLGGGTVQATGGLLRLTDEQEAEVQKLVKSGRPDIVQAMRKLDLNAAAEKAKRALASMGRPAATRGASTSVDDPVSAIKQEQVMQTAEGLKVGSSSIIAGITGGGGAK